MTRGKKTVNAKLNCFSKIVGKAFDLVVDAAKGAAPVKTRVFHRNGFFEISLKVQSSDRMIRVLDNFTLADRLIRQDFDDTHTKTHVFHLLKRSPVGDVCLMYHGEVFWLRIRSEKAVAASTLISKGRKAIKMASEASAPPRKDIRAPLPGLIISIPVTVGQSVESGQELCVLEAMKMRNSLNSAYSSKVSVFSLFKIKTRSDCVKDCCFFSF